MMSSICPRRRAKQLMGEVGQGPRGRDLLSDLRDLLVIGVATGNATANHASDLPGQPRLGPRLPAFLVQGRPPPASYQSPSWPPTFFQLLVPQCCGWQAHLYPAPGEHRA